MEQICYFILSRKELVLLSDNDPLWNVFKALTILGCRRSRLKGLLDDHARLFAKSN